MTVDIEGFHTALNIEAKRWSELRTDNVAKINSNLPAEDERVLRKSLQNEYNAHVRRIDSLWRQFSDDYKRANGMPA